MSNSCTGLPGGIQLEQSFHMSNTTEGKQGEPEKDYQMIDKCYMTLSVNELAVECSTC